MKIAIISDSHDSVKNLKSAVEIANHQKCNYLFHLGDIISPYTAKQLRDFEGEIKAVFGNCDGDKIGLYNTFLEMGGEINKLPFKVFIKKTKKLLLHEPYLLEEIMISQKFDYIFYGHLHEIYFKTQGITTILNPGDSGGLVNSPTFYIADIKLNKFNKIDI